MRRRALVAAAFGTLCLIQIGAPASMIRRYELALSEGAPFKVRTEPVDPADAFRGRYVRLRLVLDAGKLDQSWYGKAVWVSLEDGPDGFARVSGVSTTRPPHPRYVGAEVVPLPWRPDGPQVPQPGLNLPHDRYYMEESKAAPVEAALRMQGQPALRNAWVTLRVRDGVGAIERLWIDGVPVEEYLTRPGGSAPGGGRPTP